ncbi:hypothetical protein Aab01nite_06430 [Paractinoplanes abujensis]|uniref:ThuA domain-containing protein n=1 Tax=Paractinoplanes abujensis TaxID=882441 RepID=UPI001A441E8A|nr:hypothetical protein Aab01nite_06430 [Actinoplanes abujensis]
MHAAADTAYDWPWYENPVGAYFHSHPADQTATVRVEDRGNASTAHLPQAWPRHDGIQRRPQPARLVEHVRDHLGRVQPSNRPPAVSSESWARGAPPSGAAPCTTSTSSGQLP